MKKKLFERLIDSTKYSIDGLTYCFKEEQAFRWEVIVLFFLVIPATFIFINGVMLSFLAIALFVMVILFELINSAIEAVVDRISEDIHCLSKAAKDMGSAIVLISLLINIVFWLIILYNYFFVSNYNMLNW